jgi:hypothetical protein
MTVRSWASESICEIPPHWIAVFTENGDIKSGTNDLNQSFEATPLEAHQQSKRSHTDGKRRQGVERRLEFE